MKIKLHKSENPNRVFFLIGYLVGSHGGDGDGVVLAENYIWWADQFDEWRKSLGFLFKNFVRFDYPEKNEILFTDQSNENVIFAGNSMKMIADIYWDDIEVIIIEDDL